MDPTDDELVAKVGATNAADLRAIERGPSLLPLLDALVADLAAPMPRRMAATRVANEIRVRALAAPPRVVAPPPAFGEARAFFAAGGQLASDGFLQHDAGAFVEALYAAGAVFVQAQESTLVVTLPAAPETRAQLFAIYNQQVDEVGEEFGGEELPGHEMTEEEAAEIGHPDAVGAWVVDDLHVSDKGQTTLTFWWD